MENMRFTNTRFSQSKPWVIRLKDSELKPAEESKTDNERPLSEQIDTATH